jgi:hypothetical protein
LVEKSGFKVYAIDKIALIRTVNSVLLFGSTVYLAVFLFNTFINAFSLGAYEHNQYSNPDFGQYGWERWLIMRIPYGFLPQLLWIRRFRHSITSSFTIITIWGLLTLITILPVFYFIWVDYLEQIAAYTVIIWLVYFALLKKQIAAN